MRRNGLPYRLRKKRNKRKKGRRYGLIPLFPLIPHPASPKDTHSLALSASRFCPLRLPANTALTQQFQFLIWSGLETFSGQAVDAGLVKTEGLVGSLKGAKEAYSLSESDFHRRRKKEFPEPEGRVRTRHFNSQIAMKLKVI